MCTPIRDVRIFFAYLSKNFRAPSTGPAANRRKGEEAAHCLARETAALIAGVKNLQKERIFEGKNLSNFNLSEMSCCRGGIDKLY
jgi:hypothetical protein